MARGLLVLGTDTGCGKTVVSTLLLASLRARSIEVAALKPVETGCDPDPLDALALAAAAAASAPIDVVCPYRFALPAAPRAAAEAEGKTIRPARILECLESLASPARFVIVEGAGGAGTPYARDLLALDLARVLDLPVLLVARAALGTIGQSLVALRAMEGAGVRCLGVVLCRVPGLVPGPEDPTNAPLIEAHSAGVPVLGTLPLIEDAPPSPLDPEALRAWADGHARDLESGVDLDRLVGSWGG